MGRYLITLSYDGTAYHGWQIQPTGISVQEELQRALSMALRVETSVTGAGRTDTGVHAHMMTAHFDTDLDVDCSHLAYKLNRMLPQDIAVSSIKGVDGSFHARFSATSRTYIYYIHTHKNPFIRAYSWELHYDLDFAAMNMAAATLLVHNDFAAFQKSKTDNKTTLCKVSEARWIEDGDGNGKWHFIITADRFLRNMVRAIVGTLIDVGRHKISVRDFINIIESGDRRAAGESAPANGLFLERIVYDTKEQ